MQMRSQREETRSYWKHKDPGGLQSFSPWGFPPSGHLEGLFGEGLQEVKIRNEASFFPLHTHTYTHTQTHTQTHTHTHTHTHKHISSNWETPSTLDPQTQKLNFEVTHTLHLADLPLQNTLHSLSSLSVPLLSEYATPHLESVWLNLLKWSLIGETSLSNTEWLWEPDAAQGAVFGQKTGHPPLSRDYSRPPTLSSVPNSASHMITESKTCCIYHSLE
jgi:hypothetical protein